MFGKRSPQRLRPSFVPFLDPQNLGFCPFGETLPAVREAFEERLFQKIEAGSVNILLTTVLRIQKGLRCSWEKLLGRP